MGPEDRSAGLCESRDERRDGPSRAGNRLTSTKTALSVSGVCVLMLLAATPGVAQIPKVPVAGRGTTVVVDAMATLPSSERQALTDLYTSTKGAYWYNRGNWRNGSDTDFNDVGTECTWFGVTCDAGQTHVVELNFPYNNLDGPLPSSLTQLTSLQRLDLYYNPTRNLIPDLSPLSSLSYLDMSFNYTLAHAPIPSWLSSMTSLRTLNLYETNRTGLIPDLSALSNLRLLNLGLNPLLDPAPCPAWLASLTTLQDLRLPMTQRTGAIPDLSALTGLWALDLASNPGLDPAPFPPWLSSLTSLWILNLYRTNRTGQIPDLGALHELWILDLHANWDLDPAPIPVWLQWLTNLQTLNLNGTHRVGAIPELTALTKLKTLTLSENEDLDAAPIPAWLASLTSLEFLDLSATNRTGAPPSWLGGLGNLRNLYLGGNRLEGRIPAEVGDLTELRQLWLGGNALAGPLPGSLANLVKLLPAASGGLDLRWNALYSSDATLTAFLNTKHGGGDWQSTQTVAPGDLTVAWTERSAVVLSWTPIAYTANDGGYGVWRSTDAAGPYQWVTEVAGKAARGFRVTGLSPATSYYFAVAAYTDPHVFNANEVWSEVSPEVAATTCGGPGTPCTRPHPPRLLLRAPR